MGGPTPWRKGWHYAIAWSNAKIEELADPGIQIEARYTRALGQAEIASSSSTGQLQRIQRETLALAGSARLEEIRSSMT